jgi:intermediate cleaving peptidase 55
MNDLHRRSVELLREELQRLGFSFTGRMTGVLERILYPHYLAHPVGIGTSFHFNQTTNVLILLLIDLHEPKTSDRYAPWVPCLCIESALSNERTCYRIKSGMVITIEPGVYVPRDDMFPAAYRGLGIRIEDEVLIGKEHPTVLSSSAPKEVRTPFS